MQEGKDFEPASETQQAAEGGHPWLKWAGAGLLLAVLIGLLVMSHLRLERAHEERLARTDSLAQAMIAETAEQFADISLLTRSEAGALRSFLNEEHVERAKSLGVSGLDDREEAEKATRDGRLELLEDTPYYRIQDLDYSIPYVTESTANLLDLIGIRFQEALQERGLPEYRYVISSLTRTDDDQRRLRQINANAADLSSHMYGTTIDIHYEKFDYIGTPDLPADTLNVYRDALNRMVARGYQELAHTRQQKLKAVLGRVIRNLQEEGKLLAIYERRQPVYHLTVAKELPEPSPTTSNGMEERLTANVR